MIPSADVIYVNKFSHLDVIMSSRSPVFVSIIFCLFGLLHSGCFLGPGFFSQKQDGESALSSIVGAEILSDADGARTGKFLAASNGTQTMTASDNSGIAGASLEAPPGSLSIDTDITIEEGVSIADSEFLSSLGLDASVNGSANSVVVASSAAIDALQPLTLAISIPESANLVEDPELRNLIVFYRIAKQDAGGGFFEGIIPRNELSLVDGKVKFEIRYFGVYQAVYLDKEINVAKEAPSTKGIETKREKEEAAGEVNEGSIEDNPVGPEPLGPPPEPIIVSSYPISSTYAQVEVRSGGPLTDGFVFAMNLDSSGVAPADCTSGNTIFSRPIGDLQSNGGLMTLFEEAGPYPRLTPIALRVCAQNAEGVLSNGVVVNETTLDWAIPAGSCGGGNLDSTSTPCTVSTNVDITGGKIVSGLGSLVISASGSLSVPTPADKDSHGFLEIRLAGDLTIQNGCGINMNGKGYWGGYDNPTSSQTQDGRGPGFGKSGTTPTGGANAGQGGFDNHPNTGPSSAQPGIFSLTAGSGGGSTSSYDGGSGGGIVSIHVQTLVLANQYPICANGSDAGGAGGAGGTIEINVDEVDVTVGTAYAKVHGGEASSSGGGGSGGKVVVRAAILHSGFDFVLYGGKGSSPILDGAAGFAYVEQPLSSKLIIKNDASQSNAGVARATTAIDPNEVDLDIIDLGGASLNEGVEVFFIDRHFGTTEIGSINMWFSQINHDGRGFSGGTTGEVNGVDRGPLGGGGLGAGGGNCGAGGIGGNGSAYGVATGTYGATGNPIQKGSGGIGVSSVTKGGNGGGALVLVLENNLTMDSSSKISANGQSPLIGNADSGGGAGGSINLTVKGNLQVGSAIVEAIGGDGGGSSPQGGGGGGGCIAIGYGTQVAAPSDMTAARTAGGVSGGAVAGNGSFIYNPLP